MGATAIVAALLLLLAPLVTPRLRYCDHRGLFLGGVLALVIALVAQSTPRVIGDSGEYLAMALNVARGTAPSLSPDDLRRAAEIMPREVSAHLVLPEYVGSDGRQDLPHFWLYSTVAAPFVLAATALGKSPLVGFAALNVVMLLCAAAVLRRYTSAMTSLLVVASPILWWIDKAHTEVFTFSLVTIGVVLLRPAPWWSSLALGVAATQNPPIAGAMAIAIVHAFVSFGWRERRVWLGAAGGTAIESLHPLYYYVRLDRWSALNEGVDQHWPSLREFLTVPFDPNLGMFVHAPFLTAALVITIAVVVLDSRSPLRRVLHGGRGAIVLMGALFLLSFTQTINVNAGGTTGPSRYGVWLLPLTIPVLEAAPAGTLWLRVAAAASVVWCTVLFAPRHPEAYLEPTPLAAAIWQHAPAVDNPLAEIFAERVARVEPSPQPPIATAGCEKILLMGVGDSASWPSRCGTAEIPPSCRSAGALCYANRSGPSYEFTRAPTSPAWLVSIKRSQEGVGVRKETPTAAYVLPPDQPPSPAIWFADGWSYIERLPAPNPLERTMAWRWMADRARVAVMAGGPSTVHLRIVARAHEHARGLRVSIGATEVARIQVSPIRDEYDTGTFAIEPGTTYLTFENLDGSAPAGGSDPRRLGIAIFHLELMGDR
ncbi:MAG: hypothetical protein HY048_19170 [Acidobacteria bacterium]|nr:hypothetical protein [Acidobacteriota bacterium]